MTRDEAIKKFDSFGKSFTLDEARKDVHILIDDIYDDLETRICENCEFGSIAEDTWNGNPVTYSCKYGVGDFLVCDVPMTSPDFGCNKFKRKII